MLLGHTSFWRRHSSDAYVPLVQRGYRKATDVVVVDHSPKWTALDVSSRIRGAQPNPCAEELDLVEKMTPQKTVASLYLFHHDDGGGVLMGSSC